VSQNLPLQWKEALALTRRQAPEFYESGADIAPGPHADTIRFALAELGLAGVFCIEGVPTIGFLREDAAESERIDRVHQILWNQGLMSLLLVIREDELLAFSLVMRPYVRDNNLRADPRLIQTLRLIADSLKLRELIDSAESGRYWLKHDSQFDPAQRVDSVLLNNLVTAFGALKDDLGPDGAQALLMQSMFIAYLEDRKIVRSERFKAVSGNTCVSFEQVLAKQSTEAFEALFVWLGDAFNGNIFFAPCAFEPGKSTLPKVKPAHLKVLADFRHGKVEMAAGQLRFLGYDFEMMPISLISAVYDRFLNEEREQKNADGAFYTPMFLADFAVNQIWDELSDAQRMTGLLFDPACGSGIFLVRLFQRLVAAHCRETRKRFANWQELSSIVQRLHGADISSAAVRVAAFSLYLALLEHSNPRDLDALIEKGKLLPTLIDHTLRCEDFFSTSDDRRYDAVVGNPPWKGRSGQNTTAQTWADKEKLPHPAKDIAWCFIWKSLRVVRTDGLVGLLLPAMGVLHNMGSQKALELFFQSARVERIVNLSDLCFQLFESASRPTALALYRPQAENGQPYRFDYWVPKADLNLRLKRTMTLSRADRMHLRSDQVQSDPTVFKRKLWAHSPDERLLQFVKTLPPLSSFIVESKVAGKDFSRTKSWAIGQGFQPAHETTKDSTTSAAVLQFPYFAADDFRPITLPRVDAKSWQTSRVRRTGFTEGFAGPHILIPQGLERSSLRLRAAYTEQGLCFQDSLQAVVFPLAERKTAKLLTAILNSSLAAWFYLHETANIGTDRAKILQNELLKLPFAKPELMPDPARAELAAERIVAVMDREIVNAEQLLQTQTNVLDELDPLVCDYYGFNAAEAALIQETTQYILPALQPRRNAGLQAIWDTSQVGQRRAYAETLCETLKPWFNTSLSATLVARSSEIAILKLSLAVASVSPVYNENHASELEAFLDSIAKHLPTRLPGNVQLVPDLRFVIGGDMFLVKPMQVRHWLSATALTDAEQIAAELSAVLARQANKGAQNAHG
jgi:hypothetical protein